MNREQGIEQIEELIHNFGKESSELYLELLEEMIDRAQMAYDAREEELEDGGD